LTEEEIHTYQYEVTIDSAGTSFRTAEEAELYVYRIQPQRCQGLQERHVGKSEVRRDFEQALATGGPTNNQSNLALDEIRRWLNHGSM
jgi:hypothetical protein